METGLAGKAALVTGGASGIGLACVKALAAEGAQVLVADLQAAPGPGSVAADVTKPEDARRAVAAAVERFGSLDVLVTCAGIFHSTPLDRIGPEEWDRIQAVNLRGTFLVAQAALEVMIPRRSGRIVTIASLAGQVGGLAAGASYAASKAGVVGLTKSLARFAGPHGITVNAVNPGIIETPMTAGLPETQRAALVERTPLGRGGGGGRRLPRLGRRELRARRARGRQRRHSHGLTVSDAYARIQELLAADEPVILDGGNATELERSHLAGDLRNAADTGLWGTWGLYHAPYAVLDVHRSYVAAGCDVITTNTWAILAGAELEAAGGLVTRAGLTHWMDVARLGLRLARQAVEEAGRAGEVAVAFSVNGDVDDEERMATLRLLTRCLEDDPPDVVFLETMGLIREGVTMRAVELAVSTGIPVWLSFRRCRHGVCGVYGQHWGGPEGDLFGRAARQFEELGAKALLINCLPPEHLEDMLPWLRDFTDLPLGVYPNLGYYSDAGWRFDERTGPEEYAEMAFHWREQGAQIVGGCCGTGPAHIAAARERLAGTKPGRPRARPLLELAPELEPESARAPEPWLDEQGRPLFPLAFPEIIREPDVFMPTMGSLLVWKYLARHGIGQGKRCLDVGCGSGLLAIQLAKNGAESVRAIDIQREAVANTLANAFRNGVADRVRGAEVDLYVYEPEERFDVVVASLYQMPVDPFEEYTGHRPLDYWGRNLVDHFLGLLPGLLEEEGCCYLMQLSILSQLRTAELAERAGLAVRVLDYGFFPFTPVFREHREQIARVEQLSDAYHLSLGGEDVMVAYLLELSRR